MDLYQSKLLHNYHELQGREKWKYWLRDRLAFSPEKRFFYEGCRRLPGQMYIADRKGLYDQILEARPKLCFEIGTYTGGGSTFFLASAFEKVGSGKVVTLEADEWHFNEARNFYKRHLSHLLPFVEFVHSSDVYDLGKYVKQEVGVECVFLDGAEDAGQTQAQYDFFQRHFKTGSLLMAHDWDTEKMHTVRPMIEADPLWRAKLILGQPESVGFVVFERKGDAAG